MNLLYKLDVDAIARGAGGWSLAASRPRFVGYTRCVSFNMRPSCDSSRFGTEAFEEKPARLLPRSSSAWPYSSILQPGDSCLVKGDVRPVATLGFDTPSDMRTWAF